MYIWKKIKLAGSYLVTRIYSITNNNKLDLHIFKYFGTSLWNRIYGIDSSMILYIKHGSIYSVEPSYLDRRTNF